MDLLPILIAIVSGLGIGILSGLFGIGGGVQMIPVFRLGFGLSALEATATSLFAIIPTSLTGCVTHLKKHTCILSVGLLTGLFGACLSPLGVWLANQSPAWLVTLAVVAVICYSGVTMFRKALAAPKTPRGKDRVKPSSSAEAALAVSETSAASAAPAPSANEASDEAAWRRGRLWLAAPIGAVAGFASGYIGVGGGFIMVPLFVSLLGLPMRFASGTSLAAIVVLAIPGAAFQFMLGNVNLLVGLAISLGAIPGAIIGGLLASRLPERPMRFMFTGVLLLAAVSLVVNETLLGL